MSRPRFVPGSAATFVVRTRSGKKPLDAYLGSRLGVVAEWAADLVAGGHVDVDGVTALPGDTINLSAGPHRLDVRFPLAWPRHMAATEMELRVLLEDELFVALDKPAGVVVHPARGHLDNRTLQNGVRFRYRHLLGRDGVTVGPPHRLDKDTSGVVLFALRQAAYTDLVNQFASGGPRKEYLAILDGAPPFTERSVDAAIGADPEHKGRGRIVPTADGGKAAHTDFHVLEKGPDWALALATPRTGRPHQIRVHAASLGFPLAGDREYNPRPERLGLARQALHAAALEFTHPGSGARIRVEAPLPADMAAALDVLRGGEW